MEKTICPFCHNISTTPTTCSHCFNELAAADANSYYKRMTYLGLRINNQQIITEYASLYLEKNDDLLIKYYLMYALNDLNRFTLEATVQADAKEIFLHMLKYEPISNFANIKGFLLKQTKISKNTKDEYLIYIQKSQSRDYPEEERAQDTAMYHELRKDIIFSDPVVPKTYIKISMICFIISGLLYLFAYLFGIRRFSSETKYFYTIFIMVIPSLFLTSGLSIRIFKKVKKVFCAFLTLIVLVFVTYLFLFKIEPSLLTHFIRVLRAIYEFSIYLQGVVQP